MGLFKRAKGEPTAAAALSHIAFIMDGNGRWAKRRKMPREYGHRAGAKTFRRVVRHCFEAGIGCVTVYAFSTENWKRPQHEVDEIMRLLSSYIDEAVANFSEYDAEVRFIGRREGLSPELAEKMDRLEQLSSGRKNRLNIAMNYGGRDEIVRAVNRLIGLGKREITEDELSAAIDTAGRPDPDLVVRTGGDLRTSNFLLWQSAYAEYAFTDTLWPDLGERELDAIIKSFSSRHRRYGGL
jgi:undecaprenyl diphosphate synthase